MSRIGKHPVPVPAGVDVAFEGQTVRVKGKKGELSQTLPAAVTVALEDNAVVVRPRPDHDQGRAMWGLSRTLVANMVKGVTDGFSRDLAISGVGYRAAVDGQMLTLQLGYSHDIKVAIPSDIEVKCPSPTAIQISGADRQRVGQIAAEIRSFRMPEPYKGKGIRYSDETIRRKEGKKK
ncbi:50S ribosomal protein L6 [Marinivivus vitaminiproducens]|uniref:50S ribosomal protein L6 n=1 Tax=Marinivivus vitaminiproducens TaxID=3035935 RepID=UPI0027A5565A|nr:50S ribosomal protein L6 [Geminicoccaceae bacterium SCSIO 64248]